MMETLDTQLEDATRAHSGGGATTARHSHFDTALKQLGDVVGRQNVKLEARQRACYARSTLPQNTSPRAIVCPGCTEELQAIVGIANEVHLQLHPISTGRNWGYGDACASTNGQIILDLGRMNRILEVNEALAYAVIEPGVTQGQLREHLEANGIPLWTDATGAGPGASIIGNTLERGFGHTPYGDRFAHACNFEVVMPDGSVVKTGFGHFDSAQTAHVYKWGVGPYLDGLFTQSNFGIVTRMTVWLQPKPECFAAFFFSAKNPDDLGALIEALRPLKLRGTLRSPVHIGNDLRLVAMEQSYPWAEARGQTPLDPVLRASLRERHGIGAWTGSGALYGSTAEVAAAKREIRKALSPIKGMALYFFGERKLQFAKKILRAAGWLRLGAALRTRFGKMETAFKLLQGISPENCVQGGLWRVKAASAESAKGSANPLDHGAGLIWLSPVVPMTRSHVEAVNNLLEPIFNSYGFDYQTTFSMVTERALCAVTTISYDKKSLDETRRASECHAEALDQLMKAGYPPYRAGWMTMKSLWDHSNSFFKTTAKIKAALDPHGILSPKHYVPEPSRFQKA